jgi:hypothetical protein
MIPPTNRSRQCSSPWLLTAFRRLLLLILQRSFSAVEEERDPPCSLNVGHGTQRPRPVPPANSAGGGDLGAKLATYPLPPPSVRCFQRRSAYFSSACCKQSANRLIFSAGFPIV